MTQDVASVPITETTFHRLYNLSQITFLRGKVNDPGVLFRYFSCLYLCIIFGSFMVRKSKHPNVNHKIMIIKPYLITDGKQEGLDAYQ